MRIASLADVKSRFSQCVRECHEHPIVITRNGRATAALIPISDPEEIEGLVLANSPKFRKLIALSRQRLAETGGVGEDEFWAELESDQPDREA